MKRLYLFVILALFFSQLTNAQKCNDTIKTIGNGMFVTIDEMEYGVADPLPVFTTQIVVGPATLADSYQVKVEYPELKRLTSDEVKFLKKNFSKVGENIVIEHHLSIERKIGKIDVSLIPFVKRKGTYYRVVSCKLAVYGQSSENSNCLSKQQRSKSVKRALNVENARYAERSVLSTGKWVKIRVGDEGVYSLSKSFLASAGFSDPSRVKLYGYGGLVQDSVITYKGENCDYDDLEEIPLYRNGNKILFYANGVTKQVYVRKKWRHVNNPYSSYSYYFLTEGENPAKMNDVSLSVANGIKHKSIPAYTFYEEDAFSWYSGGQQFFDSYDFLNGSNKTYTVKTPNAVKGEKGYITIAFTAANATAATTVGVTLNSSKIGTMTIPILNDVRLGEQGYKAKLVEKTYSVSDLSQKNDVGFSVTSGHSARLDYVAINYQRTLDLSSTFLPICDPRNNTSGTYSISLADKNTKVWRIGKAGRLQENIVGRLEGNVLDVVLPVGSDRYVAVNTAADFPLPEFVEHVKNQNLHGDKAFDMIVIVPKSGKLVSQAQRLAKAHETIDNLKVRIVKSDEIYNEFSSGTPDAMAYRRYLKMLYDRAESEANMPKYLLLLGDAGWDNRMITSEWKNISPDDYLLCYESWNSINEIQCYVSDDFFGFLDDGEGKVLAYDKLDIHIGRIPVVTENEARAVVDKCIAYMSNENVGAWKNLICVMGDDDRNNNSLMSDAESIAKKIEKDYPRYNVRRVYWGAYQVEKTSTGNTYPVISKELKNYMKNGALIMNYTGHGAPNSISHEKVLMLDDFRNIKSKNQTLWILSSCETVPFDSQEETLGEVGLLNPGGAIAFIGATRSVYSNRNKYLNTYLMENLLKEINGKTMPIGMALSKAKSSLISSGSMNDRTINKLKYILTGDPALRLMSPTEKIVIDSINGKNTDNINVNLQAGSVAQIVGHVEDSNGSIIKDYTGVINASIYDKKELVTCQDNAGNGEDLYKYYDRTRRLFEGTDSVLNGRFVFDFPVSIDASYSDETCLMSLYSVTNDKKMESNGYNSNFSIQSPDSFKKDSIGPAMFIYLNDPDFKDGDKTNLTPYFVAMLKDEDGINATGSGIGHDLELIIDGNPTTSYVLNDHYSNDFGTYTEGNVHFSIPRLEPGSHRLLFRAWDMLGNSSSQILNFVSVRDLKPQIMDVKCYPNPATIYTDILISYDRPLSEMDFNVKIYNMYGQIVYETDVPGHSDNGYYYVRWNLTTTNGAGLPGGLYFCRVSVSENEGKSSTKTKKLIILNNK